MTYGHHLGLLPSSIATGTVPIMNDNNKIRENRRAAQQQALVLAQSRRRDSRAIDYGDAGDVTGTPESGSSDTLRPDDGMLGAISSLRTKLFPSGPGQPNPFGTPEVGGKIYSVGATKPVPPMTLTLAG
jgi:hypothetical protein